MGYLIESITTIRKGAAAAPFFHNNVPARYHIVGVSWFWRISDIYETLCSGQHFQAEITLALCPISRHLSKSRSKLTTFANVLDAQKSFFKSEILIFEMPNLYDFSLGQAGSHSDSVCCSC